MLSIDNSVVGSIYFNDGLRYLNANQFSAAIANFNECLAFQPNYLLANWYKSLAMLALGEYVRGFAEHDSRWDLLDWGWGLLSGDVGKLRAVPAWRGEPLDGKRVLIQFEQGFGDSLMMLRYLPVLARMGARMVALMPHAMQRLVAEQYGIEVLTEPPTDLAAFDYRVPMFGVMVPLKQTPANIPGEPFITPKQWRCEKGEIGIVWAGRSRRELTLPRFLDLLGLPEFHFVSLRPDASGDGVPALAADDFADTVENIARMQHVVTVDTSVAHLAAAMGHPSLHVVLPLNMDWRWHNAQAWYPSIHVYRQQTADDWELPFRQVRCAIVNSAKGESYG